MTSLRLSLYLPARRWLMDLIEWLARHPRFLFCEKEEKHMEADDEIDDHPSLPLSLLG